MHTYSIDTFANRFINLLFIVLCLLVNSTINAQQLNWQWAKNAKGPGFFASSNGICSDNEGNIYLTGDFFDSSLILGNDTIVNHNPNEDRTFVEKIDSRGNVIWYKTYLDKSVSKIIADRNNNIYLEGSVGIESNIFVSKLNEFGDSLWQITIPHTYSYAGGENSGAITFDNDNGFYLPGFFDSIIIFSNDTLSASEGIGVFVAKFDSMGNRLSAKTLMLIDNNNDQNYINDFTVDAFGNGYLTGSFDSYSTTNALILGIDTLSNGFYNYCVKYDPLGNVAWSKSFPESYNYFDFINSDLFGNVYLVGEYRSIAFPNDTFSDTIGDPGIFLTKYDAFGNFIWAKSTEPTTHNYQRVSGNNIADIKIDSSGNIYAAGNFSSPTIAFGNDTLINPDTSGWSSAFFVTKYDSLGNVIWAKQTTGNILPDSSYFSIYMAVDNMGDAYITGDFTSPSLICGTDTLINVSDSGQIDLYIAKIGFPSSPINSVEDIRNNNITVYPNPSAGQFYFKGIITGGTLEIYDLLGEKIYDGSVTDDNYLLNISGKSKGIYFYKILSKTTIEQQGKIVLH